MLVKCVAWVPLMLVLVVASLQDLLVMRVTGADTHILRF